MDAIRIAHISDLHFGSPHQEKVWEQLRNYLNDTLKPNLILITGDIAHTPKKELFGTAKDQLDLLRVQRPNPRDAYRVCPGNHDRHPLGNAPGKFASIVNFCRGGAERRRGSTTHSKGLLHHGGCATCACRKEEKDNDADD